MMYIDDCLRSLYEMMIAPSQHLRSRTYNVAAMSFTPEELFDAIKKRVPNLVVEYKPDGRQKIGKTLSQKGKAASWLNMKENFSADSWPQVFDDSEARKDWAWQHTYGLEELVDTMITALKPVYETMDKANVS